MENISYQYSAPGVKVAEKLTRHLYKEGRSREGTEDNRWRAKYLALQASLKTETEITWAPFFFESNQFFDTIKGPEDWTRLRAAYPDMSDDQLLDSKEATYAGRREQEDRDAYPNYGMRYEHDGERTLRGFFDMHGMSLLHDHHLTLQESLKTET